MQKYGFPCTLWAVYGLYGIVVKCTAAIFFPTENYIVFPERSSKMTDSGQWQKIPA